MNNKKKLTTGLLMMVAFVVVLVGVFTPLFNGHNGLEYLDNLYNSISKASAYYVPQLKAQSEEFKGKNVNLTLKMTNAKQADITAKLLTAAGGEVTVDQEKITVKGDFSKIMLSCLTDADHMFHNRSQEIKNRYNQDERLILYTWWVTLKTAIKDLNHQKQFALAKFVGTVQKKAVECSYNFYKIEPQKITDRWGIVLFSLLFYVIYTVWYGYSVMFLFEGTGFQLEDH